MCLLGFRSQEGRSGRARSATAAVRAVPGAGHAEVTCPEGAAPVSPWVCVPELPVWGESFQTCINSLNLLAICKVLGCCGVSLGVSPLQGWLGPGRADEPELELLFARVFVPHSLLGGELKLTLAAGLSDPRDSWNVTTGICFSQGSSLSLAAEMLEMFALAAARRKPNAEESRESCWERLWLLGGSSSP